MGDTFTFRSSETQHFHVINESQLQICHFFEKNIRIRSFCLFPDTKRSKLQVSFTQSKTKSPIPIGNY
jgi:hypothetical protein